LPGGVRRGRRPAATARLAFLFTALPLAAAAARGQSTSIAPSPAVAAVRALGPQFRDNPVNVTGADGATSLPLADGRALWVFGDTVEGPFESIHGMDLAPLRSNTGALVPEQDAAGGIREFRFLATADGKRPRQLVPFGAADDPAVVRLWAIHGAAVGERVYLYYHRIRLIKGVDVFESFQLEGMGLARADVAKLEFTRLPAADGGLEFWKGDQPGYGVFVESRSEHVYLWGSMMTGMFLARVRPESIEDSTAYEYLAAAPTPARPDVKPRWADKFDSAAVLFDSVPNEMSAAYNEHLKKYVAIHAFNRENQIVLRTAPQITGPWSPPELVYRPPDLEPNDMIYAAKEHPELARDGGRRIYVTFVNSRTYIPELIEVTFR
jgi:hypothetical protein